MEQVAGSGWNGWPNGVECAVTFPHVCGNLLNLPHVPALDGEHLPWFSGLQQAFLVQRQDQGQQQRDESGDQRGVMTPMKFNEIYPSTDRRSHDTVSILSRHQTTQRN